MFGHFTTCIKGLSNPEAYSEHGQTSKVECFEKKVND